MFHVRHETTTVKQKKGFTTITVTVAMTVSVKTYWTVDNTSKSFPLDSHVVLSLKEGGEKGPTRSRVFRQTKQD